MKGRMLAKSSSMLGEYGAKGVTLSSFLGFFVFGFGSKLIVSLFSFVWFLVMASVVNIFGITSSILKLIGGFAGFVSRCLGMILPAQSTYFTPVSGTVLDIPAFSYFSSYSFLPNFSLIVYFAVISTVLALLLLVLPLLVKPSTPGFEKNSSYECGFEPFVCKNEVFESHFLVVGVLFLLFDLELIFLFPLGAVAPTSSWLVSFAVLPFLGLLLIGFIFEWVRGALLWPIFYAKRNSVF